MILTEEMIDQLPISKLPEDYDNDEEDKPANTGKISFIDFTINDIPIERLRKQYLNYSYELPFSATDSSYRKAVVGDKPTTLNEVRLLIKERFYLDDWQVSIFEAQNFNAIALIVPNIPESKDMIIKAMENEGYLKADECEITREEMSWSRILFFNHICTRITDN